MGTITYLEGRINKVYSEQRGKLRERRRQDVRDQADVLTAMTATNMALLLDQGSIQRVYGACYRTLRQNRVD